MNYNANTIYKSLANRDVWVVDRKDAGYVAAHGLVTSDAVEVVRLGNGPTAHDAPIHWPIIRLDDGTVIVTRSQHTTWSLSKARIEEYVKEMNGEDDDEV